MDFDDGYTFDLFLEIYGTLPRAGPGGDDHTVRALDLVPGASPRTVLDLGCGPGPQTVVLAAALPAARLVAVDVVSSMVDRTEQRLVAAGLGDRVEAVVGDMASPPVDPASQDLIWCEGAIYNLGVTEALIAWRPLLRPGGTVVFTEPVWLKESIPTEIVDWWSAEYPAISDRAGVETRIEAASYQLAASFVLPSSAWTDEYYEPMQDRIRAMRQRLPNDPIAQEVIAAAESEIDYFRRFSDCYSYEFFIAQPNLTG